jgi:hypothetical protein
METRAFCRALFAIGLLSAGASAQAANIDVTNLNDSGAGSLRQAIQDAAPGDGININLAGTIDLTSGSLIIDKNLIVVGPGARTLTISRSGSTKFRILHVTSGFLLIFNVTMTNGDASSSAQGGGGILADPSAGLYIYACAITNNTAGSWAGGGILNNGGNAEVRLSTISGNQAGVGGGIENNGQAGPATVFLYDSTIANNTASTTSAVSGGGGGIDNDHGTLVLDSCTIAGNTGDTGNNAAGGGGLQNISGSSATVTNTLIADNTTNQLGPDVSGAFTSNGYNLIRIRNGSAGFSTSTDQTGTAASPLNAFLGPLQNNGGHTDTRLPAVNSPAIDKGKSSVDNFDQRQRQRPYDDPNIANAAGGDGTDIGATEIVPVQIFSVSNTNDFRDGSLREAIIDAGPKDLVIFDRGVEGTINLTSGPLAIDREMTIQGPGARKVTVTNATGPGFEISGSAAVVIADLTIGNNAAAGVNDNGNVVMTDCTIAGNLGGGISVGQSDSLSLTRCAITGNSTYQGAGIHNDGTAVLTNCTIANNTAIYSTSVMMSGRAGGIFNNSIGTLTLTNCTVSENAATGNPNGDDGGGLELNGTVHLANTIVAGNTTDGTGPDIFGAGVSDGYNLIGISNGSSGFTNGVKHDLVGAANNPINANLGALRNNGGQTNTKSLGVGSPAINAANDAVAPATDQRQYVRPDTADIGAFEYNATISVTLANISTRALVGTDDNVLIGGFIITGSDDKKVILRAIGPSLGVPGKIADPTLELHASDGHIIASNDNWKDAANKQEIIDSGVAPTNDLESAISIILQPGAYTVIMRGAGNTTGVGVVEAYDLDRTGSSILANISTRAFVQTADNVLIGGFILLGSASQKVIVRALGPSTGVPGAMADPMLELHDGNGNVIGSNDNWRTTQEESIIDTGIPPASDAESAIVQTLNNGPYTAIVRGVNGTTGVAVVEVYALN